MFRKAQSLSPGAKRAAPTPETPPLSRSGRKLADAIMAAAKFKRTVDGKRLVRQYEVYGIVVTEWMDAEKITEARKEGEK
jgi:hypothetical protein